VQILGGQGVTGETEVARIFADLRAFRIYDGPSEVHRWSIAKRIIRGSRKRGLDATGEARAAATQGGHVVADPRR
jgi:hypothetical protein